MSFKPVEDRLAQVEEALPKMKELIADLKICNSDFSKEVLMLALKKISRPLVDFNLVDLVDSDE